jgi:succinyl-diaminopimelate desuccinylase
MYKDRIIRYIDEHTDEMLDDLKLLVKINSEKMSAKPGMPFGKGPLMALNAALAMAGNYGMKTKNYDNYAGAVDLNDGAHALDILAHLDVVPAQEGWTVTEAFTPLLKDGRIYGRGTSDDKGPAVAALYAMRAVKELNIPLKKNVRLILGTNEENGSSCIAHYYETEKEADMTFSPDGEFPVVNIEKGRLAGDFFAGFPLCEEKPRIVSVTGGKIVNAVPPSAEAVIEGLTEKDAVKAMEEVTAATAVTFTVKEENGKLTITSHGQNAHASTPENGKNALTALLLLLTRLPLSDCTAVKILKNLYDLMPYGETDGTHLGIRAEDRESGKLTVAFSQLTVTGRKLEGIFDCRYPLCVDGKNMVGALNETFEKAGLHFNGERLSLPHHVPGDSAFVKELLGVYEDYTGLPGRCISMGGGTYVHDLKNGVAFGAVLPGTDTRMHAPDEFAVIDQLTVSAKIFAQVIADLCA